MEKNDINLINMIILVTKKIFKLYNQLYELEFNNQKDSSLYKETLKNLKILYDLEEDYYKDIPKSKLHDYITYSDRGKLFNSFTDFTLLLNGFTDLMIYKRIFNKLINMKESLKHDRYLQKNNKDYNLIILMDDIFQENHKAMLTSFIFETNKLSNTIHNTKYKKELKKLKYLGIFLNEDIEKSFKYDLFFENKLYLNNRFISDTFDVEEDIYQDVFLSYYEKYIKNELKSINTNADNSNLEYRLLLTKCFIKAFNNINDNNLYLKKKIYDIITSNKLNINLFDNDVIMMRSERLFLNGSNK